MQTPYGWNFESRNPKVYRQRDYNIKHYKLFCKLKIFTERNAQRCFQTLSLAPAIIVWRPADSRCRTEAH